MIILNSIVTALALAGGFYFGFKLGKDNELPSLKKHKKERKVEKEEKEKASKLEQALANLDRYDGSDKGQEEIV